MLFPNFPVGEIISADFEEITGANCMWNMDLESPLTWIMLEKNFGAEQKFCPWENRKFQQSTFGHHI